MEDLSGWENGLMAQLAACNNEEELIELSMQLRRLLDVDPSDLEPLPRKGLSNQAAASGFCEKQIKLWRDRQLLKKWDFRKLGVTNSEHLSRLLIYLTDRSDSNEMGRWLSLYFNDREGIKEAHENRRFLAAKIGNSILQRSKAHRDQAAIDEELRLLARGDTDSTYNYENSPHFRAFLGPFLSQIKELATQATKRNGLPRGDGREFVTLIENGSKVSS